jgi:hypothetical protein
MKFNVNNLEKSKGAIMKKYEFEHKLYNKIHA